MENQNRTPNQVISSQPKRSPQLHNWKRTLIYILLEFFIIGTSVGIGIQIGKNQIASTQAISLLPIITQIPTAAISTVTPAVSTPTTSATAPVTWKTFNDEIHKVSFQYPSNARVYTWNAIAEVEYDQDPSCPPNSGAYGCAWFVRIYLPIPNTDHKSLDEYIKEKFSDPSAEKYSATHTRIAGLPAIDVKILSPGASPAKMYYVQRKDDILFINAGVFGKTREYQVIVDKLLATLSLE